MKLFMKFETDRAKRQARVAHRKRMKRLDKAPKRADAKDDNLDPAIAEWNKKTRKSFLKRKKDRERSQRKFDRQKKRTITVIGVIAFVIVVLYYAMIIQAWYYAPVYMAFGWFVEKLMKRLDKAPKRADAKYTKDDKDKSLAKRKSLKAHQNRMKRLDRVDRAKGILTRKRLTVTGVIAFVITVLYYAMIIQAWYYAPVYMAFGWFVKWLKREGEKAEKGE